MVFAEEKIISFLNAKLSDISYFEFPIPIGLLLEEINNQEIKFIITDFKNEISVSFKGTIPNLFAEGKGVVAEGMLKDKRFFEADRILAKHDENYMPPELKNILSDNAK